MTHTHTWRIIGHEWATDLLAGRIANGRISHAYLITGARGLGKSLLARRLAQAMVCTGSPQPCGTCRHCDKIERGQHPDLVEIAPDGASIKIEQVRDMMSGLTLRPNEARCSLAIISSADRLTPAAADALLKTLEEPPHSARLILVADVAEAISQTISSRCQVIALRPVPIPQIEAALQDDYHVPADQAALLARLSGGRPGWAIRAVTEPDLLQIRYDRLVAMLDALHSNRTGRFAYSEAVTTKGAESIPDLLEQWRCLWRDVVLITEGTPIDPVNVDWIDALSDLANRVGRDAARQALRAVHETAALLDSTNANARLALDVMLLKMPY